MLVALEFRKGVHDKYVASFSGERSREFEEK
jgi:hypothetical protein